jgi:hypothetical protein
LEESYPISNGFLGRIINNMTTFHKKIMEEFEDNQLFRSGGFYPFSLDVKSFIASSHKRLLDEVIKRVKGKKEKWAHNEHERWSKWQAYLHSSCIRNTDGSLTIPVDYVERWTRQMNTEYKNLTFKEQDSDRAEVDPYITDILSELSALKDEIE